MLIMINMLRVKEETEAPKHERTGSREDINPPASLFESSDMLDMNETSRWNVELLNSWCILKRKSWSTEILPALQSIDRLVSGQKKKHWHSTWEPEWIINKRKRYLQHIKLFLT